MNYRVSEVKDMKMRFEMEPNGKLLENRGLTQGGRVQEYIDNACIRLMEPYTPMQNGALCQSVKHGTEIGSGLLVYASPYARYQYYGEVYGPNYPITEGGVLVGFYSPPKKQPTGREIEYSTARHPKAGKKWFERMKADYKDEILAGAKKIAGGRQ
ncbi:MAG: minor capsid protein [Lachnospiraceae bacterium]